MATKLLITAAVPFHTARLQSSMNINVIKTVAVTEVEKLKRKEEEATPNSKGIMRKNTRKLNAGEKLHLRRLRNKAAAQASREKAKHLEGLLKERLSYLKYEKMKLLLENKALKERHDELAIENNCLKLKAHSLQFQSMDKENNKEVTFKHASFVNVPLQKEWVLPKIFFYLMLPLWEILKEEALTLKYRIAYISIQQYVNSSLKLFLNLACIPWKSMIPPVYLQSPLIFNG